MLKLSLKGISFILIIVILLLNSKHHCSSEYVSTEDFY